MTFSHNGPGNVPIGVDLGNPQRAYSVPQCCASCLVARLAPLRLLPDHLRRAMHVTSPRRVCAALVVGSFPAFQKLRRRVERTRHPGFTASELAGLVREWGTIAGTCLHALRRAHERAAPAGLAPGRHAASSGASAPSEVSDDTAGPAPVQRTRVQRTRARYGDAGGVLPGDPLTRGTAQARRCRHCESVLTVRNVTMHNGSAVTLVLCPTCDKAPCRKCGLTDGLPYFPVHVRCSHCGTLS